MSGVGFRGNTSRCFFEWQKFMDCYTASETTEPSQCRLAAEDYKECLHHGKERERSQKIAAEYDRKTQVGDEVPTWEVVPKRNFLKDLGIIN